MRAATVLASLVLWASCGGGSSPASTAPSATSTPPTTSPQPATPEPTPSSPVDCDEACTTFAVCHEKVFGGDFRDGSECVDNCEGLSDSDRAAWARDIADASAADDCKRLFDDG